NQAGGAFGSAMALSEGQLLVGAPGDDSGTGSATLFEVDGDSFTQAQVLRPVGSSGGFGSAVSISGKVAVVGAPGEDAIYVFQSAAGEFAQIGKITGPAGSGFGSAVAVSGTRAGVGAPEAMSGTGAASYRLSDDDLVFQADFE
ncbi:MAG: hypothetical protein R3200_13990, partial [Xanthomonadales bacterium]|nr:hypothetical protein [Xanthomonadales bacterium]